MAGGQVITLFLKNGYNNIKSVWERSANRVLLNFDFDFYFVKNYF